MAAENVFNLSDAARRREKTPREQFVEGLGEDWDAAVTQRLKVRAADKQAKDIIDAWEANEIDFEAELFQDLSDESEDEMPEFLVREDGIPLFYRGFVNTLHGASEAAKTMIALAVCAEVLLKGGSAWFIDMDNNGRKNIRDRLIGMGVPRDVVLSMRFNVARPTSGPAVMEAVKLMTRHRAPDVVVFDSLSQLLSRFERNFIDGMHVTQTAHEVLEPVALAGACVVLIDHTGNEGVRPVGSHAKKAVGSGTQLYVERERPYHRGKGGASRLFLYKDRSDEVGEHCIQREDPEALPYAGKFVLNPEMSWRVEAPSQCDITNGPAGTNKASGKKGTTRGTGRRGRPATRDLEADILAVVTEQGEVKSATKIWEALVPRGNKPAALAKVKEMVEAGVLTPAPHRLVKDVS